jgi:hypothetical protein
VRCQGLFWLFELINSSLGMKEMDVMNGGVWLFLAWALIPSTGRMWRVERFMTAMGVLDREIDW